VKRLRSRGGVAAVVALLLLLLFLFRPGVYRLRNRIATTIGNALSRKVELDNVSLHFLPRPGFDLEGLVIYDDPAFSAEPMIRAQEVSAAIRFRSLLRGRLELATLSANEPSINLVRNREGRWNLSTLIERNAQIPAAPTGKPASERRPAFPYLEADNARVNFKLGQTKKSFALMNADVALWQDSDNSWGARIKAEPVRTDFNLTDTGLLQINAAWQRAANLRTTPMRIMVQWQKGQLGQITQLLSGKDRGWRGGVSFGANLSGTPEALRIESQTAVDDFHRYDIVGHESLRLATTCAGTYNAVASTVADLLCESPANGGTIRLRGNMAMAAQQPNYDLRLEAEKVPLAAVVRLLRQAKKQIPGDLTASGLLNVEFRATQDIGGSPGPGSPQWQGDGSATNVRLSSGQSSNAGKDEVTLGTVPLVLVAAESRPLPRSRINPPNAQEKELAPAETHLRIGPATLALNGSEPVTVGGWISAAGYRLFLRGDAELTDLYRLEKLLGLPVTQPAAEGSAKLEMNISGPWQGFAPAVAAGSAQLRNVRAEVRGLNTPIEIASANLSLTPDAISLQKISARTASTHWGGTVTTPRHCAAPACAYSFDLAADRLSTEDLGEWFTPHPAKRAWYRLLNPAANTPASGSPLLTILARGSLQVGRFEVKKVAATQITTQVEVDRGRITLTALRGQLLEGTHQGNWIIDFSEPDPGHDASASNPAVHETSGLPLRYRGAGTLRDISLEAVGSLMNDEWIAGSADGKFEVDGSGDSFREILSRSDGKLKFTMRNGSLPHIEIPGAPAPLPVHRFTGELLLKKGNWKISAGRLESRDGIYRVSGTATPEGLDFELTRADEQSWTVTGTLADPQVDPVGQTQAKSTAAVTKSVKP